MKRRSASPTLHAAPSPRSLSRWLLPILSTMSLLMNVALFWSFNETTYDTYSGLKKATDLEAREVDQLWEHGKTLRGKVQQMQQELDAFKEAMNKEQALREKTRSKHMHSFSLPGISLLETMRQRRMSIEGESATAPEAASPEAQSPSKSETAAEPSAVADENDSVTENIERRAFKMPREEAEKALQLQAELRKPIIKKFRLPAKEVVAAAKLTGKSSTFKLTQTEAQKAMELTKPVIKKFTLPAAEAAKVAEGAAEAAEQPAETA